jgi:outer membrane protein assembly factor BamB
MCRIGAAAAALVIAASAGSAGQLARTIVWSARVAGGAGSPTPYPSAPAADSVIVCSGDNHVLRIDGKGQVVFKFDMGDPIGGIAACADIDHDGKTEVVAATVRGRVVALTGEGKTKWSYETRHPFVDFANVVLAARPGSATGDVLIHHQDGWLTCLDGKGRHRWSFRIARPGHISAPAVADINNDGKPEYVCGIDAERVIALTEEGHLLWEFASPDEFGREVAVIADADRNHKPEVYILKGGATSAVFCVDGATGKLLWTVPIASKCYCALTLADINGDGYDEVLAGTKYNQVLALSHTGGVLWQTTMGGSGIFSTPAVADIDGDGRLEIVVGVRGAAVDGNSVFVLDTQGNLLGGYPQNGDADRATTIADINHDGLLEVISCSRDTIFAYRFGNPTKAGAVLWPCYRANAALTGSQLPLPQGKRPALTAAAARGSLMPKTFEAALGDAQVSATWAAPTPTQGYVEVTLTDPRGKRTTQAFRTASSRQSVEVQLPFHHGGRYTIDARLLDTAHNRVLLADSRRITFTPLATERRMVEAVRKRDATAAAGIAATAPHIAAELQRRQSSLHAALTALEDRVRAVPASAEFPQSLVDDAAALRARAAQEESFLRFAARAAAAAPHMLFAVWPDRDPWDNTDPRDELPAAVSENVAFSAWAYGSQKEDFCFSLVGLSPDAFAVRVEPGDLLGPNGAKAPWEQHLTLLQVIWMPTKFGGSVPDMLPLMNSGRTLELAPGGFAQVWLVVDTRDLAPGTWAIKLRFQSLTMAAAAVEATLRLDALPVALPYPYPWKLCNWAWPMSFAQPLRERVIENLISHGSNVMYAPTPSRACDAEGHLLGEVDWVPLDELVAKAKPGDPFLFFGTLPLNAPSGMTQDSPVWKKAHQEWMREFVAHLASIGIDYRHFAFYPVDEPGNSGHTGIEQLIAAATVLREADPQAPIYADPAGGAYPTEWIRELDPWVDVWAPASGLSDRPDIREIISTRNRQVWMYDAPGNVRVLSPLGFYRMQPWTALRNGARGSGYWVYFSANLWAVGAANEPDYGTVYIDRTEVVDSRRWRASHDGVQDVTAVLLLDEALAEAQKAGVDPMLCDKARSARDDAVAAVTAGADDKRLSFDVLQRSRRRIADALLALRSAIAAKKA